MNATIKTIGGVSVLGLIVFSVITMQRNSRADKIRNEQLTRQHRFQEIVKDSKNSLNELTPEIERFKDLTDDSSCYFNPYKIDKSFKLNVNIAYPCRWEKVVPEEAIPTMVAQYANILTDTTMVAVTANIVTLPRTYSPEEIDAFNGEDYLRSVNEQQDAEYLRSKKVSVDNVKGSETLSVKEYNGLVTYFRTNTLYYKSYFLIIKYSATSPSRYTSFKILDSYDNVFVKLFKKTDFIN